MPLVSVIVPVYNVAPYLRRCLDSLLSQTLKDIEIICINDGSTDDSPQILEEYAKRDDRIRVIHQENRGLSGARNTGLAVVNSSSYPPPYITFVDSDDWIAPQTYSIATEIFLKDSELDFVCWGINTGTISNGVWVTKEYWHPFEGKKAQIEGKVVLSQKIKFGTNVVVWNKLYKTAMIRDKNIIFPEKLLYEDNAFWMKFAMWAKTGFYIKEPYYHYHVSRPLAITTETRRKKPPVNTLYLPIFQDVYDYYSTHGKVEEYDVMLSEMLISMIYHGLIYSSDESAYFKYVREFIESYAHLPDNEAGTLDALRKGKALVRFRSLSAIEKILSVTNVGNKKVFRIFGMEFAVNRKKIK